MIGFILATSLLLLSDVSAIPHPVNPPCLTGTESLQHLWTNKLADLIIPSCSPAFGAKAARWSTYEAPSFDAVFLPESEEELSTGLAILTSANIPFLVKAGGHGYSTTLHQIQDAVMINMEKFNYTRMNDDLTATIGSGATFNDMVYAIGTAGREATVGSCPCVGVSGATLGGGVGRLQGLHGLASDQVRKFRLALWNGTIIEASNDKNADLFWGMRGAGQNFGVVIETSFETYPATNNGFVYEAQITLGPDSLGAIVDVINSMLPLDPALAIVTIVAADPKTLDTLILVNLVYAGPEEKGKELAGPLISLGVSTVESIFSWVDLPIKGAGGFNNIQCIKGNSHSLWGLNTKTMDKASVLDMASDFSTLIKANPALNGSAFIFETFATQAVDAHPDDYSAFPHRGQINNFFDIFVSYDDKSVAQTGDDWARRWRDHFLQPSVSGYEPAGIYQNYAHGDEASSILYGYSAWRHERLTTLKNTYDPRGVFNGYHAIPADLAKW